jgi:hypothetical protein
MRRLDDATAVGVEVNVTIAVSVGIVAGTLVAGIASAPVFPGCSQMEEVGARERKASVTAGGLQTIV